MSFTLSRDSILAIVDKNYGGIKLSDLMYELIDAHYMVKEPEELEQFITKNISKLGIFTYTSAAEHWYELRPKFFVYRK